MKKAFISMGMAAFLLTGCANEVELSDADCDRVVQYAADLVLKYDANYNERLLTTEEEAQEEEKVRLAAEKEEKLQELLALKENASKEEKEPVAEKENKDSGMSESGEEIPVMSYDINEVLQCSGFEISRAGYELAKEYSDGEENAMSVDVQASAGKKLLITKYTITNNSDKTLECDIFSKDVSGSTEINGSIKAESMVTMLLNDLGTYRAPVEAGISKEVVLLFEIPDSVEEVQQLELTLHIGNDSFLLK